MDEVPWSRLPHEHVASIRAALERRRALRGGTRRRARRITSPHVVPLGGSNPDARARDGAVVVHAHGARVELALAVDLGGCPPERGVERDPLRIGVGGEDGRAEEGGSARSLLNPRTTSSHRQRNGCPRGSFSLTLLIDSGRSPIAVGFRSLARSSSTATTPSLSRPAPPPARVTACALAPRPARVRYNRKQRTRIVRTRATAPDARQGAAELGGGCGEGGAA